MKKAIPHTEVGKIHNRNCVGAQKAIKAGEHFQNEPNLTDTWGVHTKKSSMKLYLEIKND